jgi:hypothetical protein
MSQTGNSTGKVLKNSNAMRGNRVACIMRAAQRRLHRSRRGAVQQRLL